MREFQLRLNTQHEWIFLVKTFIDDNLSWTIPWRSLSGARDLNDDEIARNELLSYRQDLKEIEKVLDYIGEIMRTSRQLVDDYFNYWVDKVLLLIGEYLHQNIAALTFRRAKCLDRGYTNEFYISIDPLGTLSQTNEKRGEVDFPADKIRDANAFQFGGIVALTIGPYYSQKKVTRVRFFSELKYTDGYATFPGGPYNSPYEIEVYLTEQRTKNTDFVEIATVLSAVLKYRAGETNQLPPLTRIGMKTGEYSPVICRDNEGRSLNVTWIDMGE